MSEMT